MAQEIEVKLEAEGAAARRLLNARWLRRLEAAPPTREHLVSVYYDTASCALRDAGISLRVRRIGNRRVQTVKAGPRGACGPFCQEEWEYDIGGSRPDLENGGGTALDQFSRKKLRRELRPVFATDVTRAAVPLHCGGSEIEIAIDRGQVRTRHQRAAISEIELELKHGDPSQLVKLARRIARETDAAYGIASKAERGYALTAGNQPKPVCAAETPLDKEMTAGDAFRVIGFSCLHHFAANRAAVEAGVSGGIHQMRVGLRRLRAAMSFFKDLLPDAESERVKGALKWLLGELGPARDLDVLISESIEPLQQERADGAILGALKSDLKHRRRSGFDRAKAAVESARYRQIVLDTALWMAGGSWTMATEPLIAGRRDRRIADFAAEEFRRRHRKIAKKLGRLGALAPMQRHKLRIAAKKLRYADEFFASLYPGAGKRRLKRHRAALKVLQSALGKLNDMQVHDRMAGDFVHAKQRAKKQPQKAFALGLISGEDHAHAHALIAKAADAGHDLAAVKPFWK
jgi:triphosphatase